MRPVYLPANPSAGVSDPCVLDPKITPANILLAVELGGNTGGGASYSVEYSPDAPFATYATNYNTNANWYTHPTLVTLAADGVDQLSVPAQGVRIRTVVPGTGGATAPRLVVIQAGYAN